MIEEESVKSYFELDEKIESERRITSMHKDKRDEVTMNKISIKSILKSGVNQKPKKLCNAGVQTVEVKTLPCKCNRHRSSINDQAFYSN